MQNDKIWANDLFNYKNRQLCDILTIRSLLVTTDFLRKRFHFNEKWTKVFVMERISDIVRRKLAPNFT